MAASSSIAATTEDAEYQPRHERGSIYPGVEPYGTRAYQGRHREGVAPLPFVSVRIRRWLDLIDEIQQARVVADHFGVTA